MKDVSVAMAICKKENNSNQLAQFVRPVEYESVVRDTKQISRNISGLVTPYQVYEHDLVDFAAIKEKPLIYWWDDAFLKRYAETPKLGDENPVKFGANTGNNSRFIRYWWEIHSKLLYLSSQFLSAESSNYYWVPYIKGAMGKSWYEDLNNVILWNSCSFPSKPRREATFAPSS